MPSRRPSLKADLTRRSSPEWNDEDRDPASRLQAGGQAAEERFQSDPNSSFTAIRIAWKTRRTVSSASQARGVGRPDDGGQRPGRRQGAAGVGEQDRFGKLGGAGLVGVLGQDLGQAAHAQAR